MFSCNHNNSCSFNSERREDLSKHYKNDHQRFLCFSCEKHYNSSENRRVHNVADHKNLCYQCNGCDKKYSRHGGYSYHQKTQPTCGTGYLLIPKETDKNIRKQLGIASAVSENMMSQGKFSANPALNPSFSKVESFGGVLNEAFSKKKDKNEEYLVSSFVADDKSKIYHF